MSAVPASILAPKAPQVNLIPPEVASRRAAGRARGLIFVGLFLFLVLLGALFYWANAQKAGAEKDLGAVQAEGSRLQAEIDKFAEVPRVQAELLNTTNARLYAGSTEVRWKPVFDAFQEVIPYWVDINSLNVNVTSATTMVQPPLGLFSHPGVGVLSFTASSLTYPDVAALEAALDSLPFLMDTTIPAVQIVDNDGTIGYSFSGSATITANALDSRFTDEWFAVRHAELADAFLDSYSQYLKIFDFVIENPINTRVEDAFGQTFTNAQAKPIVDAANEARTVFDEAKDALAQERANLADANTRAKTGDEKAPTEAAIAQAKITALNAALNTYSLALLDLSDAKDALFDAHEEAVLSKDEADYYDKLLKAAKAAQKAGDPGDEALQAAVDKAQARADEADAAAILADENVKPALAAFNAAIAALPDATAAAKTAIADAEAIKKGDLPKAPAAPSTATPSPSASATPGGAG